MQLFKKHLLTLITGLSLSFTLHAQNWTWTKREADPLDRYLNATDIYSVENEMLATDQFGNTITYALVRTKRILTGGDTTRLRINKVDRYGNLLWQKFALNVNRIYDMKMDRWGNTYAAMVDFTFYNGTFFPSTNTGRCLTKFDPQGKLIWKKPLSEIECTACADGRLSMAFNPANDHLYLYVNAFFSPLTVADSVYTFSNNAYRMMFLKMDTSGHVKYSRLLDIATSSHRNRFTLDVDNNDRVLLTASIPGTYPSMTFIDTVVNRTDCDGVIAWLDGATGNRIKTKTFSHASGSSAPELAFGQLAMNGETGFWITLSRATTSVAACTISLADSTLNLTLPANYDNSYFAVLDGNGKLKYFNKLGDGESFAYCASKDSSNYYIGGSKRPFAGATNYTPYLQQVNAAGSLNWTMTPVNANDALGAARVTGVQNKEGALRVTTRLANSSYPVFGNDTIGISGYTSCNPSVLSSTGGVFNVIKGLVYFDSNKNGVKDSLEPGLPNVMLADSARGIFESSGTDGRYYMIVDTGNFNLKVTVRPRYTNWSPAAQSVSFGNSFGQSATNKNFRLTFDTVVQELQAHCNYVTRFRPGFYAQIHVGLYNNGNVILNGTYSLKLDTALEYISSDTATNFISTDSISWNYTGLQPFAARHNYVTVRVKPNTPIGYRLKNIVYGYPILNDSVPANNIDSALITVGGAVDPNDKLANPLDEMVYERTQSGTQYINYTVRFQNTGTDTAFNVRIWDNISTKLDLNSIEILTSSHPVQLHVLPGRKLEFFFPDILLPDSNVNEKQSHAFVAYRIKPNNNLLRADTIYNKASIYFDYNDAVVTNSTRNYFAAVVTGIVQPLAQKELLVYPNPVDDILYYTIKDVLPGKCSVRIYDINGRLLETVTLQGIGTTLQSSVNTSSLGKGTYILQISGKNWTAQKKIVKMK